MHHCARLLKNRGYELAATAVTVRVARKASARRAQPCVRDSRQRAEAGNSQQSGPGSADWASILGPRTRRLAKAALSIDLKTRFSEGLAAANVASGQAHKFIADAYATGFMNSHGAFVIPPAFLSDWHISARAMSRRDRHRHPLHRSGRETGMAQRMGGVGQL